MCHINVRSRRSYTHAPLHAMTASFDGHYCGALESTATDFLRVYVKDPISILIGVLVINLIVEYNFDWFKALLVWD